MSESRVGKVLSSLTAVNESKEELGWYVVAKENGAVTDGPFSSEDEAKKNSDSDSTVEYGTCDQKGWFHKDGK